MRAAGSWFCRGVCCLAEAGHGHLYNSIFYTDVHEQAHWLFDGICVLFIARQMTSLRYEWRCCLGALFRQATLWSSRASTTFPTLLSLITIIIAAAISSLKGYRYRIGYALLLTIATIYTSTVLLSPLDGVSAFSLPSFIYGCRPRMFFR